MKMLYYQYRKKSNYEDKMVVRSFNLHDGISYSGEIASLYWIRALFPHWALWQITGFMAYISIIKEVKAVFHDAYIGHNAKIS